MRIALVSVASAVTSALAACSFARPSSSEPHAPVDCRVAPPIVDTAVAAAITVVAIVAATSKCESGCDFIQNGAALPIGAIAASFAAGAAYGYYRYGRCSATLAAAAPAAPAQPAAQPAPPPYATP